jgi:iron complex transport system substrate-binding protein
VSVAPGRPRRTRRRLVALSWLVAVAVTAGACTFGPSTPGATEANTTGGDPTCGEVRDGLRRIEHGAGTTEVPMNPQRIVLLDTGEMDAADAVGVSPVGVVEVGDFVDLPDYLSPAVTGAERIGTIAQPDLEAITRLRPDLILGNMVRNKQVYDQLAAIAPTVLADDIGPMWRENFELYSTAMGRCREADARLQAYDAQVAAAAEVLGPERDTLEVSVVRALYGTVRVYHRASFISSVLEDIGLQRPQQQSEDTLMKEIGIDKISAMDGDVIFWSQWGSVQPLFNQMRATEAYAAFDAVRNDRVYEVSDSTWMLGLGVLGATAVAADVERMLGP